MVKNDHISAKINHRHSAGQPHHYPGQKLMKVHEKSPAQSQDSAWSKIKTGMQMERINSIKPISYISAGISTGLKSPASNNGSNIKTNQISASTPSSSKSASAHSSEKIMTQQSGIGKSRSLFNVAHVNANLCWKRISRPAPGFFNNGNTCYLNSVLQCLVHVPPLAQVLLDAELAREALAGMASSSEPKHDTNAASNGQSPIISMFKSLIHEVWKTNSGRPFLPRAMVMNIRRVGKQFRPLRQEDAHEYLRQLVDCMHEEILKAQRVKLADGKIAETTFIGRVFGGNLCSELRCPKCTYVSRTFNYFQDLSLEVSGGINSIKRAYAKFTEVEHLTKGNEWRCEGCRGMVLAQKRMTVVEAPKCLVLHLKRFTYGQGKVNKPIAFEPKLTIPVGSDAKETVSYQLTGIVVHHGGSVHSGHYVAYIRSPNGTWYEMNDATVTSVSIQKVQSQQAYICFYTQEGVPAAITPPAAVASKATSDSVSSEVDAAQKSAKAKTVNANAVIASKQSSEDSSSGYSSSASSDTDDEDIGTALSTGAVLKMKSKANAIPFPARPSMIPAISSFAMPPLATMGLDAPIEPSAASKEAKDAVHKWAQALVDVADESMASESDSEADSDAASSDATDNSLESQKNHEKVITRLIPRDHNCYVPMRFDLMNRRSIHHLRSQWGTRKRARSMSRLTLLQQLLSSVGNKRKRNFVSTNLDDSQQSEQEESQESEQEEEQSEQEEEEEEQSEQEEEEEEQSERADLRKQSGAEKMQVAVSGRDSSQGKIAGKSVKSFLIQHSLRSRELSSEGHWDDADLPQYVIDRAEQEKLKLRQKEQAALAARQSSEWDKYLDSGRTKKLKKDKIAKQEEAALGEGWGSSGRTKDVRGSYPQGRTSSPNANNNNFQKVLDVRKSESEGRAFTEAPDTQRKGRMGGHNGDRRFTSRAGNGKSSGHQGGYQKKKSKFE